MAFRHDRRRRVLSDEAPADAETSDAAAKGGVGGKDFESYATAARRQQQPHVVDLVPLGWLGQTLVWLGGLTVIAALEAAYLYAPELIPHLGRESITALDLASPASLAHWVSTIMLCATAALGVLVYRLRSHRLDDYRGSYRVWRWLPAVALLLSMHETAPLEPLGAAMTRLASSWTGLENPRWWTLGVAIAWTLVAVRMLVEMRSCLLASIVLALTAVDLIGGATAATWFAPGLSAPQNVMLVSGLRLLGHLALLGAVAMYARQVILEAEGVIKRRPAKAPRAAKPKRSVKTEPAKEPAVAEKKGTTPDAASKPRGLTPPPRTDLDSPKPLVGARPAASRPDSAERQPPRPHVAERPSASDDEDDEQNGLTRAERKRLKRQQRQAQ